MNDLMLGASQVNKPNPKIIVVSPSLTISKRIALGSYDWKNDDITSRWFPHNSTTVGEWEYDMYHPDCSISSEDAKKGAEVDGWVVGKTDHLLALGEQFPDLQRQFRVIALGSVSKIYHRPHVLGLWESRGERGLGLYSWNTPWKWRFRFLRVRMVPTD
jgi:hypothetical protein